MDEKTPSKKQIPEQINCLNDRLLRLHDRIDTLQKKK